MEEFPSVILNKLSHYQREECDRPLSIKYLKMTLSCMATEKASRLDGFPSELYNNIWDDVDKDLLNIYKKAILIDLLGSIIYKDNIKLTPKLGNLELITRWRPITLLNVSYKITTKAFDLKLRPLLTRINPST